MVKSESERGEPVVELAKALRPFAVSADGLRIWKRDQGISDDEAAKRRTAVHCSVEDIIQADKALTAYDKAEREAPPPAGGEKMMAELDAGVSTHAIRAVESAAAIVREHIAALAAEITTLREALEIIAGERQCMDNLMSHAEIARAALALQQKAKP